MEQDLEVRRLVRRLCRCIASQQVIAARGDPEQVSRLQPQLEDTAHSVLLGLLPEATPPYVPPDERGQRAAAGLAAAAKRLRQSGYDGLACDLEAATSRFESCASFQLLGSVAQAEAGIAPELPLTEHSALLALLLGLAGTRPSLRQRRFTFQGEQAPPAALWDGTGPSASAAGPLIAPHAAAAQLHAAPLTTAVFCEAPDPQALSEGACAVAALLPEEAGLPTDAFAGMDDVQDLAAGLGSRPVWSPAAAPSLPPPRAAAWLPVPASLAAQQQGVRRGVPPRGLGLPLSMLSMGDEPGSCTLFAADAAAASAAWGRASDDGGDVASADSVEPQGSPGADEDGRSSGGAAGAGLPLGQPSQLWSEGEAELAAAALLALQGVASALLRLQALLATPGALPRASAAGLLRSLAAAGELRQRLQAFAAALHGGGTCVGSGSAAPADPVQQAFGAAVAAVLQRQSGALQQLEQQEGRAWVERRAAGGGGGAASLSVRRRTPSLLQVALHTRRLQLQLRSLGELCWCCPEAAGAELQVQAEPASDDGSEAAAQRCRRRWQEGFPRGTDLLDYLYCRVNEADATDLPMLRFLFCEAVQPYLRHVRAWAFAPLAVAPEFGTAGDRELLTLAFLPHHERAAGVLVPADPPAFLRPLQAAFMRAGSQLRLLYSLEGHGRQLARQLGEVAEEEAAARWRRLSSGGGVPGAAGSISAAAMEGLGGQDAVLADDDEEAGEPWIGLGGSACGTAGATGGSADLQLSAARLQEAVHISQEQDAARTAAVDAWLGGLALRRRLAQQAATEEQLGRAAAQSEEAAQLSARHAAALSRQQSGKAALLREQSAAVTELRLRQAAERARGQAEDRRLQARAALRQHSQAVAELEQALAGSALGGSQPHAAAQLQPSVTALARDQHQAAGPELALRDAQPAGLPVQPPAPSLPPLKTRFQDERQQQREQQQENASPLGAPAAGPAGAPGPRQPLQPSWGALPHAASAVLQHQLSLAGDAAEGGGGRCEEAAAEALAPLSAVLETSLTHSVLSQYRAVSHACVRLFLDELKVLEHLEALRRYFFQGAGDWAEELVGRLGAHADSLAPLPSHQAHAMLADAARGTTAEADPFAAHLRIRLLARGSSAVTAEAGAVAAGATPQRRARSSLQTGQTSAQLNPAALDCLDCVALDYQVGWPLSAVLTEDTLQGYAAVFSLLARLRRVAQLLRGLTAPLAEAAASSGELLLSEEEADRAHRRLQALRAFRFAAAQFVASLQAFLHARTSGDRWVHLLAKLMVSSEEVAAAVVSRQPSAAATGVLSRMSSMGPTGKAAHRLAQQLGRQLSGSVPGSPSAAAAGGGRLSRFNSLLGGTGVGSAPASAAATPRPDSTAREGSTGSGTARQLSRFAARPPLEAGRQDCAAPAGGGDAFTPTAAAVGRISTQASLTAELAAAAAAAAAADADAGGSAPDAAAWADQFRRSQQGIADLQELLDLHRRYVRQASEDCLTFCGNPAVRQAAEACMQSLLDFAYCLRSAVQSGQAHRRDARWSSALRLDGAWAPLAAAMAGFEARRQRLQQALESTSSRTALRELQLDFSGWGARRR